jgi:hypothetical protein
VINQIVLGSWRKSPRDRLRLDQRGQRPSRCPIVLFGRRTRGNNNIYRAKFGKFLGKLLGLGRFYLDRWYLCVCFSHGTLPFSLSGRGQQRGHSSHAFPRGDQQTENSSDGRLSPAGIALLAICRKHAPAAPPQREGRTVAPRLCRGHPARLGPGPAFLLFSGGPRGGCQRGGMVR